MADTKYLGFVGRVDDPPLARHLYLLLDGSASMKEKELKSEKPKHRAVAEMVQDLIYRCHEDSEVDNALLTVICYDSKKVQDIRVLGYDVKADEEIDGGESDNSYKHFYRKPKDTEPRYIKQDLDQWDPLINHGGQTPIGLALGAARVLAEDWVLKSPEGKVRRAIICLLSDGMNYPDGKDNPNGVEERERIMEFTRSQDKGRIRIATVGYYQHEQGKSNDEDEGRRHLQALAYPQGAYFESNEADKIVDFIVATITVLSS